MTQVSRNFVPSTKFAWKAFIYITLCVLGFGLVIYTCLRNGSDPDYLNYYNIYTQSSFSSFSDLNIEPFYFYLNKSFAYLGFDFKVLLGAVALISILPKIYIYWRESPSPLLSFFIYITTIFFMFDYIAIRQGVAIALFMLAVKFITTREWKKYSILISIATLFHVSAVILLPLYFIVNLKPSKLFLYLSIVISLGVGILEYKIPLATFFVEIGLIPEFAAAKFSIYMEQVVLSQFSIKQIFLSVMFVAFKARVSEKSKYAEAAIYIYIYGLLICTVLNSIPDLSYRLRWYFFWPEIILVAYIVNIVFRRNVIIYWMVCAFVCFFYASSLMQFVNELYSRGNDLGVMDYIFKFGVR